MAASGPSAIFAPISALEERTIDSDKSVVRTVRDMLQVRGLRVRGIFIDDPTNIVKWMVMGTPPKDTLATPADHTSARLHTMVFRVECNFNGRNNAFKLLHRCWSAVAKFIKESEVRLDGFDRHVIILSGPITKRKLVSVEIPPDSPYACVHPGYTSRMDVFDDRSLRYNILNHVLVPIHTPLRPSDIDMLGRRYGSRECPRELVDDRMSATSEKNDPTTEFILRIPRVNHMDPVVRFLGGVAYTVPGDLASGTVYRINRGGGEITFRRVVNDLGR